ncbi:hypothetical protein ACHHYP_20760 [Achlya hypogyna]|uniref:Uncharacterized protein n=1 Tax=Achlya hypogyna TaxID=1202772 RepID=A0A1V9YBS6_ACHHY|nr:hypothetical protein ACHHYP_20760 [Achlya hypogyna]
MFKRFLPRRPSVPRPSINWSKVTRPSPRAVYGALSNKVAALNLYSVLSKMHWTHTAPPTRPPRPGTIVGGRYVPFNRHETKLRKAECRALGKKLYAIPEEDDDTDDDSS